MTCLTVWVEIHRVARITSDYFNLRLREVRPMISFRKQKFGECHKPGRVIELRVHQLRRPDRPLSRSVLLGVLAHELAHLRVWDHGPKHRAFEKEIKAWWKQEQLV